METKYNKTDFPIKGKWLLKPVIQGCWGGFVSSFFIIIFFLTSSFTEDSQGGALVGTTMVVIFSIGFSIIGMIFSLIVNYLKRATFDFSFEDNFIVLHQGIITRSQRNIPYAVIQHVIVKQGFIDRYILHLTTLMIENAVQDASAMAYDNYSRKGNRYQAEAIGFLGNRVTIPGLSNEDALRLKELVLKKMKENQVHPSFTGM